MTKECVGLLMEKGKGPLLFPARGAVVRFFPPSQNRSETPLLEVIEIDGIQQKRCAATGDR